MQLDATHTELHLAWAFDKVCALSAALEEEARFVEEMELRMDLFVAEANGEIITSAPPPWRQAA